jgi:hypothetical protein
MYVRRDGWGRYAPRWTRPCRSASLGSSSASYSPHVMPSTPAAASRRNEKNAARKLSGLRWWSSAVNRSSFRCLAACRTRSSAWVTRSRFCARGVRRRSTFSSVPALGSAGSASGCPALFVGFTATMAGSDFPRPCTIGYGSSPSRCGPSAASRRWPDVGSPRFRRDPFVRDGVFDLGRASAPRISVPHMLPSATLKASASAILLLSRLNSPPRTIAVYASPWALPPTTQHSLPGGRYPLPGPDFHRLDRASFAWRTSVPV